MGSKKAVNFFKILQLTPKTTIITANTASEVQKEK
jgi:hypothetical protein